MSAFLKVIEDNYLVFLIITIFLMLSLIGYYVDKKTRKDADLKPMFSKIGKDKGPKEPGSADSKKSKGLKLSFGKKEKKEASAPAGSSTIASGPVSPNSAPLQNAAPVAPTQSVTPQAPTSQTSQDSVDKL